MLNPSFFNLYKAHTIIVTYLRARALNRSLLELSLTTKGLVLAYSDMNSFSVIELSCKCSHYIKEQETVLSPALMSILQGPGLATMSLG